jgi:hypothetical protein
MTRIFFERRWQLVALAMTECVEVRGRFIEHLVDGIWLICEESYWGVPAHLTMQRLGLPDVSDPTVDLFAAETGMLLAYIALSAHSELLTVDLQGVTEDQSDDINAAKVVPSWQFVSSHQSV